MLYRVGRGPKERGPKESKRIDRIMTLVFLVYAAALITLLIWGVRSMLM